MKGFTVIVTKTYTFTNLEADSIIDAETLAMYLCDIWNDDALDAEVEFISAKAEENQNGQKTR